MEVIIDSVVLGKWKENCYIISCDSEAWIVDPGEDSELIIKFLNLDNYNLKGIICTHGHFDHIGAAYVLQQKYEIPFFIHSKDKRLITQGNLYRNMLGDTKIYKTPKIDDYLDDMEFLDLKHHKIKIHYTPGHTNGGVCFQIGNNLIAGDMLLKKYIPMKNLPGENKKLMNSSIKYLLSEFKGFVIYPGHGKKFILDIEMINEFKQSLVWE